MKKRLLNILLFFIVFPCVSQNLGNNSRLATQYYRDKEYEKAAPLFEQLYSETRFKSYLSFYINCLIELKEFDKAERTVRRNYKATRDPEFLVLWGDILKQRGEPGKANDKFHEAINSLAPLSSQIIILSNIFINKSEFEFAELTLQKGQKLIPGQKFHNELARIYLYLRDYEAMLNEYLALLKSDPSKLSVVKSRLQTALNLDIQENFKDKMRITIIRKTQMEPNVPVFSSLLVWFYLQEENYEGAMHLAMAMDRRFRSEEEQIIAISRVTGQNKAFNTALKGYDYVISKGENSKYFLSALYGRTEILYLQFVENPDLKKSNNILSEFELAIKKVGKNERVVQLIIDKAQLLAFYFNRQNEAEQLLREAFSFSRISKYQLSQLKNKLADVMVCKGDFWESSLLYAQVIDQNSRSFLADDVKLKRAKLAWYMGDIEWAQAQLDALKASTSKTISNNALNLSLLISSNMENDTLHAPLQLFARADLWEFRNKPEQALNVLDSLSSIYSYHKIRTEVLFRKAKLNEGLKNNFIAEKCLDSLLNEYPHSHLADDALINKAKLVEQASSRAEEAKLLYLQLLTNYPSSIFAVEARRRYRSIQGE